jgi:hypothetical protein
MKTIVKRDGSPKCSSSSHPLGFVFLTSLMLLPGLGRAGIYYVKPDGNNAQYGTNWAQAKQTVGSALGAAATGDQIWIARGTYPENLVVSKAVALYGGFAGTETDLAQRNWAVNLSILDGRAQGTVIQVKTVGAAEARIDGLVITNGMPARLSTATGGGIDTTACSPLIVNNQIIGNTGNGGPGGGIALWSYNPLTSNQPIITNNLICKNKTLTFTDYDGNAAGIAVIGSSPLIAWNHIVQNAAAGSGGGIGCWLDSHPLIYKNQIMANSACRADTRSLAYGGGIFATAHDIDDTPGVPA